MCSVDLADFNSNLKIQFPVPDIFAFDYMLYPSVAELSVSDFWIE